MRPAPSALRRLSAILFREALIGIGVGAPAIVYVLGTNRTASVALIVLHAALLSAFTPLAVSLLELVIARAAPALPALLREVTVRTLGLSAAVTAMLAVIAAATPLTLSALVGRPLLVGLLPVYLSYALVGVGVQWAGMREHALRAEAAEAHARRAALAARIRPHFLFNALNCIEELTDTDPPAARAAVGRLARLLRSVLASSSAPMGPLEREAQLADDYLGIEKIRFGERFTYELTVDPAAKAWQVPSTVLLTLAENAVKHGVEAARGPVRLLLSARAQQDGSLRIVLSGPAAARDAPGTGYGLADVRERLRLAYEGRATFTLRRDREDGCDVELILPR